MQGTVDCCLRVASSGNKRRGRRLSFMSQLCTPSGSAKPRTYPLVWIHEIREAHATMHVIANTPCSSIRHIKGDRNNYDHLKRDISGRGFNVVYDINGREAEQVAPILQAIPDLAQYIYCSSAGVYLKSDQMPHRCYASHDTQSICCRIAMFVNIQIICMCVLWL
jgi:hypothetical protein